MIDWATLLYILAIYGLVRFVAKSNGDLKKGQINWTPWESVGITVALYFGAQLVGALALYAYGSLTGLHDANLNDWLDNSVVAQFIFILLVEGLSIWGLWNFLKRRHSNFKALGLVKPKWLDIIYVLTGFAIYFIGYLIFILLAKEIVPSLDLDQQQQIGFDGAQGAGLILVFISLVLLPPLVEETLMRGFLYSGLRKRLPLVTAALITSVLFAVAHLQAGSNAPLLWIAAIDTFILSMVLVGLREKTGSLWPSIGLHTLKNSIAFVALFVVVK